MEDATIGRAVPGQAREAQKAIGDGVAAKQKAVRWITAGQKAEVARFCGCQWGVRVAGQWRARPGAPAVGGEEGGTGAEP